MTNRIQESFGKIEAGSEMKKETALFIQKEMERRNRKAKFPVWGRNLLVACAVLTLFIMSGGIYTINQPVSYISIDVNPSLELTLNRYDRVIEATAYNDDGEMILDAVEIKGEHYTKAIDMIVESEAMQPYLTEEAELSFTVAASDKEKKEVILAGIADNENCRAHESQEYDAEIGTLSEAHGHGLSFGKYAAYERLSQYDAEVTIEDCKNMTMAEIHGRIHEHEAGGNHRQESGHGGHHR